MKSLPRRSALAASLLALGALTLPPASRADEILLTVSGPAADGSGAMLSVGFDRAMLEALPQATVVTSTDWTDDVKTFTGPLARDVLAADGVAGESVDAGALNN